MSAMDVLTALAGVAPRELARGWLVVSPHPDDETIGAAAALLAIPRAHVRGAGRSGAETAARWRLLAGVALDELGLGRTPAMTLSETVWSPS